jgi:cellular nucleic acid-binding protein
MYTTCELCTRTMPTKDWAGHKNSKKHHEAEAKEKDAAEGKNTTSFGGDASEFTADAGSFGAGNDTFGNASTGNDTWGMSGNDVTWGSNAGTSTYGNNPGTGGDRACFGCGKTGHQKRDCPQGGSGGGDRVCYGCGLTGHQKRDCPSGGGGGGGDQACFNCGEVGYVFPYYAPCTVTDYFTDIVRRNAPSLVSPWAVVAEAPIVSASTATSLGKSALFFTSTRGWY